MSHPYMVVSRYDVARRTLIPDVFTPVIATSQAELRLLACSIFSLLLRTEPEARLGHFTVLINGADDRTGDTGLQDRKQAFLEDLRRQKTPGGRDMPMTLIRVWSRVGHSELCDMAVPWVHTQYYVLMHDDVIVLDRDWPRLAAEALSPSDVVVTTARPYLLCAAGAPMSALLTGAGRIVRLPHLNTCFLVADKAKVVDLGANWQAHHTPIPGVPLERLVNMPEWLEYHHSHAGVEVDAVPGAEIHAVSHDVGAWVYNEMCERGFRPSLLPDGTINHIGAASWDPTLQGRMEPHRPMYEALERELRNHPTLWAVYARHCTPLIGG